MDAFFTLRLDWKSGKFDLIARDVGPAPDKHLIVSNLNKDQALALCGATISTGELKVYEQLKEYEARGNSQ